MVHHMQILLLIIIFLSQEFNADNCGIRKFNKRGKIVNGRDAKKNQFPWTVALQYKYKNEDTYGYDHFCGAAIISQRWLLTAAHCFKRHRKETIRAVFGTTDLSHEDSFRFTSAISELITHEAYNVTTFENDIALLKTKEIIPFDSNKKINNICLPKHDEKFDSGNANVSGWGQIGEDDVTTDELKFLEIKLHKDYICKELYNQSYFADKMMCAGFIHGEGDACQGDSGGPLEKSIQNKVYLIGVVSFGEGCARQNRLGVYTEVSHYVHWIENQMKKDETKLPPMLQGEQQSKKTSDTTSFCGEKVNGGRIVNGINAYENQFPWTVSLQKRSFRRNKHFCGAVVISNRWLLTAAHCVNSISIKKIRAVFGVTNLTIKTDFQFESEIEQIINHEKFDEDTYENDIALMKTKDIIPIDVRRKTINQICLPNPGKQFTEKAVVSGWGSIEHKGSSSDHLMFSKLNLYDDEFCSHIYNDTSIVKNAMLCAGFIEGKSDTCKGDSGGPLEKVIDNKSYLIGIVSFGEGCAKRPGVYTKVSNYINWIQQNMGVENISSSVPTPKKPQLLAINNTKNINEFSPVTKKPVLRTRENKHTFRTVNNCSFIVWMSVLGKGEKLSTAKGRFLLSPTEEKSFAVSKGWIGRIWGRTECVKGDCTTADCGKGSAGCVGASVRMPATIIDMAMDNDLVGDIYSINLMDGFNLPMSIRPIAGFGYTSNTAFDCKTAGCYKNINENCPHDLAVYERAGKIIACKSACFEKQEDKFCCKNSYADDKKCMQSYVSTKHLSHFNLNCPSAISLIFDARNATFTCKSNPLTHYEIVMCPAR